MQLELIIDDRRESVIGEAISLSRSKKSLTIKKNKHVHDDRRDRNDRRGNKPLTIKKVSHDHEIGYFIGIQDFGFLQVPLYNCVECGSTYYPSMGYEYDDRRDGNDRRGNKPLTIKKVSHDHDFEK